jgi:hypothetical protein
MKLMLPAPIKTLLPMQGRTLKLNLHLYKPTTSKAVNADVYEMKWK